MAGLDWKLTSAQNLFVDGHYINGRNICYQLQPKKML